MEQNDFVIKLIAKLNQQMSKRQIKTDLKGLDNSMYLKVIAKLSTTLSKRQLKSDLKQLNDLYVKVGADLKIDRNLKRKLQNRIKELQRSISDIQISTRIRNTNNEIDSVRRSMQARANRAPVGINIEIKKNKAIADIEYLGKRFSKLFSNVSAKQKYQNILTQAYSISDESQLRSVRTQIQAFTSELKANGLASKSLGDKWRSLIDRSKNLFSAATIVTTIYSQIRKAITTTIELDTALTGVYKVTNDIASRDQFSSLLQKWNRLAQNLSVSTKSLISSAEEWGKIGFDLDMSEQLAQITAIFEKTAEISNEKANSTLISIAQAFPEIDGLGEDDYVERVEAIGDKINKIGNEFAIDSEGVSDALSKSSAALRMANNDLDESIAIVTTANKIFQNPDEVGNMSKILSARLRGQKGELEELNENTDGMIESVSKIQTQILNLTNNKVNIFESDNETLKSTYEIIKEIGTVYNSLSDKDQAELLEIIGGKQRMSAVASLLLNYEELEKVKEASMNADSSMQQEYNKYLESAEAHIVTFKEKLVEAYSAFLSGDLIKHAADFGSAILDLTNSTDLLKHSLLAILALNVGKWVSAIGAGVLGAVKQMNTLGSALQKVKNLPTDNALRKNAIKQLGESTKILTERNLKLLLSQEQLSDNDKIRILRLQGLTKQEALAKLEKMQLTTATNTQTAANAAETTSTFTLAGAMSALKTITVGFWTSLKALVASNPIGFALMGLTTIISITSSAISKSNQALEEAKDSALETAERLKDEEKNLVSLIKKYNELDNTDRSTENTEKIKSLNDEINIALGNQAENIDIVNGKLDEQSDKLKRNLLQKLKDDETELNTAESIAKSDYDVGLEHGMFGIDPWGNVSRALTENGATTIDGFAFSNVGDVLDRLEPEQQIKQIKAWLEYLTKVDSYFGTGTYGDQLATLQGWYNDLDQKQKKYNEAKESRESNQEQQKIINDSLSGKIANVEAFEAYRREIQDTYKENSTLQNQMLDFIDTIFPEFAKKLQEIKQNTSTASEEVTTTLSFKEAWKAIGTSGDEKADKKAKEAKEKLLELAEAGKLTEEAFENSSIAENFLKQTKLSAEEATQKINELISSAAQLSSMKTGISSISNILGEKKENQSSKKTRTKGIGADTLAGMPDDIKKQTKEYEHFIEVLGDGTSSMDDCKEAANKLATAYVNSNNFLSNLTAENEDYYKSVLKEMGVENAAEVVTAALNKQKVNAKIATFDMKTATEQEISTLGSYVKSLDDSSKALAYYTLQQQIANNNALDTSDSVKNLMKLAKQCGITGEAISLMTSLAADMKTVEYYTTGDGKNDRNAGNIVSSANSEVNGVKNRLNKIIKKGVKVGTSTKVTPKSSSGSKGKSKKGKSDKSKSKQQFDWIGRALDRLSSKLDLVKAKYDNLFTVKKVKNSDSLLNLRNKNLDKQYKLLQKTEKYQEKAQKKYTKKANSVRISKNKKENASLKKAVREGRIKGSMKKLIATYGEKKAEKIQKYQDWYDKAQEQKKNRISTKTAKRENRIEKYQNIVDTTEERRSLAQAGKENVTTAKDKNAFIEKEKESIETSYEYQIRIARLKRDSLEADRLIAEKAKEIRDLAIEQHQNLAYEHQSVLDQYNAEKELATKASEKNGLIESEKAKTQELYAEKVAIAGLEGNISEQKQLQAELDKQLRDFSVEQHQNLADEYQAELDKSSAEKENLKTASEKNAVVDREKNLTSQLYAEKIAIVRIEGRISEEQQLQEELTRQMVVLEKEKFDNISHYYENLMRLESNAYTDLKNASEELETRGLIVSGKMYNSQIAINNGKKKMYEDELLSLNNQLHSIKEGTDEWYDAVDAIQACENGIAELTKDTLALTEAARKVSFTLSDKILSRFDLISSEYDLLIKFMSDHKLTNDKTGNFTKEGAATLGAYYTQLLLAEKETVTFKQSLADMYDKLQRGEEGYTDQKAWDEYYEHMEKSFQLEEKYYDIRQNMIGLMKEKYNTELDFLQDIINKRKELLQAEKDEYDYRNTIEEKTKNIGVLAKQLQALNGDDSESARSRIQQLKVNLDEAQKDLQDTEYDKWLSDQQTMLDNLYNEYHDFIDDKLNDTDALFNEAVTYLKDINVGAEVSEVLQSYGDSYGHTYTPFFENINTALGKEGDIVKSITSATDLISEHFNKQAVTSQEAGDVIRLISEIGQVDYDGDGRKRLVAAEQAYSSLSQEAKMIVDSTSVNGLTTLQQKQSEWLGLSEARKQEETKKEDERIRQQQETFRKSARDKLTDYIKRTYGANGREYACNINNASTADVGIAEAINRNGLRRVDGWNSPTSSAISQIVSWINSEGTGVNIPATADGLWMYMQNIGYSNGGIAETLQKVPGMNGDDGWVTVKKGEGIFTPEQTQQFIKLVSNVDTLNPALDAVKDLSKREYEPVPNRITNQSVGEVNIEMNLPNVTNYEEFRRRMQSDPKIEKMFKSMIWDKGDFSKYRIRM